MKIHQEIIKSITSSFIIKFITEYPSITIIGVSPIAIMSFIKIFFKKTIWPYLITNISIPILYIILFFVILVCLFIYLNKRKIKYKQKIQELEQELIQYKEPKHIRVIKSLQLVQKGILYHIELHHYENKFEITNIILKCNKCKVILKPSYRDDYHCVKCNYFFRIENKKIIIDLEDFKKILLPKIEKLINQNIKGNFINLEYITKQIS